MSPRTLRGAVWTILVGCWCGRCRPAPWSRLLPSGWLRVMRSMQVSLGRALPRTPARAPAVSHGSAAEASSRVAASVTLDSGGCSSLPLPGAAQPQQAPGRRLGTASERASAARAGQFAAPVPHLSPLKDIPASGGRPFRGIYCRGRGTVTVLPLHAAAATPAESPVYPDDATIARPLCFTSLLIAGFSPFRAVRARDARGARSRRGRCCLRRRTTSSTTSATSPRRAQPRGRLRPGSPRFYLGR